MTPAGLPHTQLVGLAFTELAKEQTGKPQAANVVALGALQDLTGVITREALVEALGRRLPAKLVEANLRALASGGAV